MVFTPANKSELQNAIAGWIGGTIDANTDLPDGSGLLYREMGTWDVTNVTDMSFLFDIVDGASGVVIDVSSFNEDISGWNVSGVTNMSQMFQNCSSFNADISGWNTSSCSNFEYMFRFASDFNRDIRTWTVPSGPWVTTNMFQGATAFQTAWYPTTPGYDSNAVAASYEFFNQVAGNICFPAGTLVSLDQGDIEIQKVDINKHTLNGKKIIAVTKTIPTNYNNVCFEKDAFEQNVPSQTVECSKKHLVEYNGERKRAIDFVKNNDNDKITRVRNAYRNMYNLLLESHETMSVCNLQVETLHPANDIAIQYLKSTNEEEGEQ